MKILAKSEDLCIGCHSCEESCAQLYFREENPLKACLRVIEKGDDSYAIITCTQCGKCIEVCPVQAISRDKKGIVRINKKICVGCYMCVAACPEKALFFHDDHNEPFKCVACGICVKNCPTGALSIQEVPDL